MRALMVEIYGRGGLTHYTYNLVRELGRREVEVTLLTSCEYELAETLAMNGAGVRLEADLYRWSHRARRFLAPLRHPRLRRWTKMAEFLSDTPRIVGLARRAGADVVHLQGANPILLATLVAFRVARRPVVFTAHDVPPLSNRLWARLLDRWIYRLADRIVVHSDADRELLSERYPESAEKVRVILHGDYRFFRAADSGDRPAARARLGYREEDRVILFFGFLSWYKGLDLLFQAMPAVRERVPNARLLVVGDPIKLAPGELGRYRDSLRDLGLEESVTFLAEYVPMEDVPAYFQAADVVALPYRSVSQSGVLHLAYAFGVPVVASRVGAFPEAVREGETGRLVEPEDVGALAASLAAILADDAGRRRMGETARHDSEQRFSWAEAAERTESVYREIAPSRSTKAAVMTEKA